MTKIFKKLILMACVVVSISSTVDAQRPKGHKWYKGSSATKEWMMSQYNGQEVWSPLWNISKDEAIKAHLFNLTQSFKMLGVDKKIETGHLVWMIENSVVETVPGGTIFTNTLVKDDGVAVSFVDTVTEDGEKFFVTEYKGTKIAWAKATCLQSTVLVQGKITPESKPATETQTTYTYASTPEVNVYDGDVNVEAPIVNVIDSTGDTYVTNNYYQQSDDRQYQQPQPYYGSGYGNAGVYAQASIGWGVQQPFCGNTWGNSMYYGPRGGGGVVCGGGSSNNQPVNVYVDVYNNNVNNNTNNNNIDIDIQDPHVYHPPTGGGPVDPGPGDPPVDGGGVGDGPIDPESRFNRNVGMTRKSTPNVAYNTSSRSNRVVQRQTSSQPASSNSGAVSTPVRDVRSTRSNGVRGNTQTTSTPAPVRTAPQQQNSEAKPRMFASRAANERSSGNTSPAQSRTGNSQPRYNQQQRAGGQSNYQQRSPQQQVSTAPRQNSQPRQTMSQSRPMGGGSRPTGNMNRGGNNARSAGAGFARR